MAKAIKITDELFEPIDHGVWTCPICHSDHDKYDQAKWCCQDYENQCVWKCSACGELMGSEEETSSCCWDVSDEDE